MQFPVAIKISGPNGRERSVTELPVTLIDSSGRRSVRAQVGPFLKPITLWEGAAYDAAGDYTQAQAEARVLEVLGDDPKAALEALFVTPQRG